MISKKWALGSIPLVTIVTIMILSQAQPAYAVTEECLTGTLMPGTYDALLVKPNMLCTILSGVTINGDVDISTGASLIGIAGGFIGGEIDVKLDDCDTVILFGFTIDGSVDISGCQMVLNFGI